MARPREFDVDVILEKAMKAFWSGGYHATSMSDLEKATGLKRGSLYKVYRDKKEIYLAAIELYGKRAAEAASELTHDSEESPRDLLRQFLCQSSSDSDMCNNGCFIVNSIVEVASHDSEIAKRTKAVLERYSKCIEQIVKRGQKAGEFVTNLSAKEIARLVVFTMSAIRVANLNREPTAVRGHLMDMLFARVSV